jgi:hypothetical protein
MIIEYGIVELKSGFVTPLEDRKSVGDVAGSS